LRRLGSVELAGFFRYDNEGIEARRVTSVENGVFKSFIMSRADRGIPRSNGHGRKQTGFAPVARQSNLVVQVSQPRRATNFARCSSTRSSATTSRTACCSTTSRVLTITQRDSERLQRAADHGLSHLPRRPPELVRGVDLIGTPLTTFSKIVAADDQATFNGVCGAESGGVPVSASSPAIFLSQVEVQKNEVRSARRFSRRRFSRGTPMTRRIPFAAACSPSPRRSASRSRPRSRGQDRPRDGGHARRGWHA
jgi:hypothetical protein